MIREALRQPVLDEELSFLLADLPDNPKDNRIHIPDRVGLVDYLLATRTRVLKALEDADLNSPDPLIHNGYAWDFALQHECQHQETIAEMLTLIHQASQTAASPAAFPRWTPSVSRTWLVIPAGTFRMGSDDPCSYDNEKDRHTVALDNFSVAKHPVTAYEWSEFMADGGYNRPSLWSAAGWEWRCTEDCRLPEYWVERPDGYATYNPAGLRPILPDEPVASISWFEAEAFAEWAGARLLTEAEWEYVAAFEPAGSSPRRYPWGDEPVGNRAANGLRSWEGCPVGTFPMGASVFGVEDLAGGVWEWTSSMFLPYPGFKAFPYDGYSKDHMKGGHRVCRGGSWASADPILRCSFRNWYVPGYRQGFLGTRLAQRR